MPARPDVILASMGRCIYCGRADCLSDEHIVPAGLDGNAVLRNASWQDCGRITSAFESRVLNSMRDFRAGLALGNKRRKAKTHTAPVYSGEQDQEITIRVPISKHVLPLLLPIYAPPQCGVRDEPGEGIDLVGVKWIRYGVHPGDLAKSLGIAKLQLKGKLFAVDFARMLAKIGYAYAVSLLGLGAFAEVAVLPAISGKKNDVGFWVGTYAEEEAKAGDATLLHRLSLMFVPPSPATEKASGLLAVAHVQLFSSSPSPGYRVVVGQLRPTAQLPETRLLGTESFPTLQRGASASSRLTLR